MDGLALGRLIREVRRRGHERQSDLSRRTGISQSKISRAEHGRLDRLTYTEVERLCSALEIRLSLDASWRGIEGTRLLDRAHAAIVEHVVETLSGLGWETIIEYSFNHFGDRGSADVVGWHRPLRALVIIEVKSVIADVQDTLAKVDRKVRVVPLLLARERGWAPTWVARLLVVPDRSTVRRVIARHEATFRTVLPARTVEVRQWLVAPDGPLAGVMFLSDSPPRNTGETVGCRGRRSASPGVGPRA